ncbi:hypothetical protein BBFGKLBO_03032 [Synechococcus sp. CBW1107]|uniref:hypothetical protein n=1 Tax=Synechococcus sp. CBW1107 TaxID=2789857 RepID=UPI002AD1F126|nr:hypothetical protein [Synechococcus sp. CBW1107]CAK6701154.1 hypothetical protein BBFGKLBO_03032 [Synechococcus sp. CBW1107]
MNRPTDADHADDLLRHIAQGPGRNPDAWVGTYHRLHRDAPDVQNDRPSESGCC